jgi:hypothetical protein
MESFLTSSIARRRAMKTKPYLVSCLACFFSLSFVEPAPAQVEVEVIPLRAPGWDIHQDLLISVNEYPTDAGLRNWAATDYDVASSTIAGTSSPWWTNLPAPFDCTIPNCSTGSINALAQPKTNIHVPAATETTFLARRAFTLNAVQAAAPAGAIEYTCDSGCVFYINGVRAGSSPNMQTITTLTPNSFSSDAGDEDPPNATVTLAFGGIDQPALVVGTNVMAIEVHNDSTASSDIGLDASLRINAIPEPTTLGLAIIAALAVAARTCVRERHHERCPQ